MTSEWFLVQAHHTAPGLLDGFRGVRSRSFCVALTGTLPARDPWYRAWLCEDVAEQVRVLAS